MKRKTIQQSKPDRPAGTVKQSATDRNEELFRIDAPPEDVARSLFRGKPKPKGQWRYLRKKA